MTRSTVAEPLRKKRVKSVPRWRGLALFAASCLACQTPTTQSDKPLVVAAQSAPEPLASAQPLVDPAVKAPIATEKAVPPPPTPRVSPVIEAKVEKSPKETEPEAKPAIIVPLASDPTPQLSAQKVSIGRPRVIGELDEEVVSKFVWGTVGSLGACRVADAQEVRVQLLVNPGGQVAIAQPDPTQPHGNTEVARCVASHMRSTIPGGAHGIAFVKVSLPALN